MSKKSWSEKIWRREKQSWDRLVRWNEGFFKALDLSNNHKRARVRKKNINRMHRLEELARKKWGDPFEPEDSSGDTFYFVLGLEPCDEEKQ